MSADVPQEALDRGVRALRALPGYHWEIAPEQVVRVVLRAATPALAEAMQAEYYGWPGTGSRSPAQPVIVTSSSPSAPVTPVREDEGRNADV